jgi:hypothetical protein
MQGVLLVSGVEARLLKEHPECWGMSRVTWHFRPWIPRWLAVVIARLFLQSSMSYPGGCQ